MSSVVRERLEAVLERIARAAQRSGRTAKSIKLVAVTKTVGLEQILPYLQHQLIDLGENRVQEAMSKFADASGHKTIRSPLHLIGPLQSNKARKAVRLFDMIQSLDSIASLEEVQRHAESEGKVQPCLLEVKISEEPSKHGVPEDQVEQILSSAKKWSAVSIQGLMGIPPRTSSPEETRPYFSRLRALYERTNLSILSMGMSDDFEIAIEEGATMIRLGTALFGSRTAQ